MALGALGLAGVPPFGTFRGKALMEEAAAAAGHPWLTALFVAVAALTSAALLRAAGRVFLGLGPPVAPGAGRAPASPHPHIHSTLVGPAVLLLAGALAVGLAPGLGGRVEVAAARFTDRPAYAAAVLQGTTGPEEPATSTGRARGSLAGPAALAVLSALLGLALALGALLPRSRPAGLLARAAGRVWAPTAAVLRDLHSGNVGDSVTWLVVGLAGFGTLLALVVR
jgi:multicomponent Na+:H+ antiporter subunit D